VIYWTWSPDFLAPSSLNGSYARLAFGAGDCVCPSAWGVSLWQQDTKHLTAEMDKNIGLQFAPLLHSQENSNSWGRHFGIFGNRLARPHYSHEARHRSWGVPNVTVATQTHASMKLPEKNRSRSIPIRIPCCPCGKAASLEDPLEARHQTSGGGSVDALQPCFTASLADWMKDTLKLPQETSWGEQLWTHPT